MRFELPRQVHAARKCYPSDLDATFSPLKAVDAPLQRIVSIIVTCNRVFLSTLRDTIERGTHPYIRHTLEFDLPVPASSKLKYPDKAEQRRVILALRALGWSYREIAEEVGLHWTRVGQILKNKRADE
jgi:hypothetical protein